MSGDIERIDRGRDRSPNGVGGDARSERLQEHREGAQVLAGFGKVNLGSEPIAGREVHGVSHSLDGVHQVATLADRPAAHSATAAGDRLVRSGRPNRKRIRGKSSLAWRNTSQLARTVGGCGAPAGVATIW